MVNLFRFLKLTYLDIKNGSNRNYIGGFYIYVNEMGSGKTLSMVRELIRYQDMGYPVYTNFMFKGQDGALNHWKDILDIPPNSIIGLDEISDSFNSRAWSKMPKQVFTYVINSRKRNIRILATAQEFDEIDKSIRTKAKYIVDCTHIGRLIINKFYRRKVYELSLGNKARKKDYVERFIREDFYSDYYDTNEIVAMLKGIEND